MSNEIIRTGSEDDLPVQQAATDEQFPINPAMVARSYMAGAYLQLCVPKSMTDEEVLAFANNHVGILPTVLGVDMDMEIRKGHTDPDRVQCSDYAGNCHIVCIMKDPEELNEH